MVKIAIAGGSSRKFIIQPTTNNFISAEIPSALADGKAPIQA